VAFADVLMRQGRYPSMPARPFTPGYDVVGEITAVGAGVSDLSIGDRVAALTVTGGYAAEVLAPAERTVRVPAGVDAAQATALVLNYVTAWQLLHRVATVPRGGTILVLGAAGGVGSALTELALAKGIGVVGTASAARHAVLLERGVRVVDSAADVGDPVDAAFDPVGGPSLRASRAATRRGGVVGAYGVSFAVDRELGRAGSLLRHVGVLSATKLSPGAKVVSYAITSGKPAEFRADLAKLLALLAQHKISPLVTTMPLIEAAEAQRRLEAREVVGKLVLTAA
jgi:NADPH:quinone reductase-like Zn-dependent oxidoreductase